MRCAYDCAECDALPAKKVVIIILANVNTCDNEESERCLKRFDFEIDTTDNDMYSTESESNPPAGSTPDITM